MEAIGRNSNLDYLCKNWADLRKLITESPARTPQDGPNRRSKRFLTADDVNDIVHRYKAGETTQQIGTRFGICRTCVATVLREQGVAIRRRGLNDAQVAEAAALYTSGKSLAWIGAHFGVSHTTVASALRHEALELRGRPGWI